jgi:amino acid transporter
MDVGYYAVSAVVAMAKCFIGLSNGTARIWMSMSRDGLLPKRFSKVHQNTKRLLTQL